MGIAKGITMKSGLPPGGMASRVLIEGESGFDRNN